MSRVAPRDRRSGVVDAEADFPREATHERLPQRLGVRLGHRLEAGEAPVRIVQALAERDLAHPDRRAESVRMAGLIIHADPSLPAVANHFLHGFKGAVEQVDLLPTHRQPRASDDPWTPLVDLGHDCAWTVDEAGQRLAHLGGARLGAAPEISSDVEVGGRGRGSARPRTAKRNGRNAGRASERVYQWRKLRLQTPSPHVAPPIETWG